MRVPHLGFVLAVAVAACGRLRTQPAPVGGALPMLRQEIAVRVAADQAIQRQMAQLIASGQSGIAQRDSVFRDNLDWMRAVLAKHGWPGRHLVGEEGSHGAWLLIQHADQDTSLQRIALRLLERAVQVNDAAGADLAYLTDRMRVAAGQLQVYGTQLQYDARGCASPRPSEEPALLARRRAAVDLMPVDEYVSSTMTALGRAAQCAQPPNP